MGTKMPQMIVLFTILSVIFSHLSATNVDLTSCINLNWYACGLSIGTALYKKYYGTWQDSQDVNAFGTVCKTQFRGSFYRWKWVWGGQFWCPELSNDIKGVSEHWKSRDGAIEHALQDFVSKAGEAHILTPEQAAQYDQGK